MPFDAGDNGSAGGNDDDLAALSRDNSLNLQRPTWEGEMEEEEEEVVAARWGKRGEP